MSVGGLCPTIACQVEQLQREGCTIEGSESREWPG
jgi:hypothetical protein